MYTQMDKILPSSFPSFLPPLPSCLSSFLPSFFPSCLPAFLLSFLPSFHSSFLPAFLPSFLSSCLPFILSSCLPPSLPSCFPSSLPPSHSPVGHGCAGHSQDSVVLLEWLSLVLTGCLLCVQASLPGVLPGAPGVRLPHRGHLPGVRPRVPPGAAAAYDIHQSTTRGRCQSGIFSSL